MQGNKTAYKHLQMQPLTALMASLGHTWIDVLKVDIEVSCAVRTAAFLCRHCRKTPPSKPCSNP